MYYRVGYWLLLLIYPYDPCVRACGVCVCACNRYLQARVDDEGTSGGVHARDVLTVLYALPQQLHAVVHVLVPTV